LGLEKAIDWEEKNHQSGGGNGKAQQKKFVRCRRFVGSDGQLDGQGMKPFMPGKGDFLINPDRIAARQKSRSTLNL
jgi:hypothetical protein